MAMAELEGEFDISGDAEKKAEDAGPVRTVESTIPVAPATGSTPQRVLESPEVVKGAGMRFYTALGQRPEGITFDAQDPDEEILLLIRRSFATNIPWIFLVFVLIFLPPILSFFSFFDVFNFDPIIITFIVVFYYVILFGVVIVNFALWYFNVGIVTNKRIVDVDLHGILSRHVSEARLALVQDVSHQQIGFLRSLFDYGDVFVQTAGSSQNIEFDRVPRPVFIAEVIGDLVSQSAE